MTTIMLEQKMTVKHFGESKRAYDFIVRLSPVNELVTCKTVHTSHVSPYENEKSKTAFSTVDPVFENLIRIV
jgi:hypothetical protein